MSDEVEREVTEADPDDELDDELDDEADGLCDAEDELDTEVSEDCVLSSVSNRKAAKLELMDNEQDDGSNEDSDDMEDESSCISSTSNSRRVEVAALSEAGSSCTEPEGVWLTDNDDEDLNPELVFGICIDYTP